MRLNLSAFALVLGAPLVLQAAATPPAATTPPPALTAPASLAAEAPAPTAAPTAIVPSVTVRITPKDEGEARLKAVWPGFFIHGWGHRYAGDDDVFLNLAGGELFSVVLLGFSLNEAVGPEVTDQNRGTSQAVALIGGAMFLGTWAWDIAGCGPAVRHYNQSSGLGLKPLDGGAQVAWNLTF